MERRKWKAYWLLTGNVGQRELEGKHQFNISLLPLSSDQCAFTFQPHQHCCTTLLHCSQHEHTQTLYRKNSWKLRDIPYCCITMNIHTQMKITAAVPGCGIISGLPSVLSWLSVSATSICVSSFSIQWSIPQKAPALPLGAQDLLLLSNCFGFRLRSKT